MLRTTTIAMATLLIASCGGHEPAAAGASDEQTTTTLLEAGDAPKALRYQGLNPSQTFVLNVRIEGTEPAHAAEFSFDVALTVPAHDSGPHNIAGKVEAVRSTTAAFATALDEMPDPTFKLLIDERGVVEKLELEPANLTNKQRQIHELFLASLTHAIIVVPEENVGAGASWRVTGSALVNGMKVTRTSLLKLSSVTASEWTLSIAHSDSAEDQDISPPGVYADKLHLDRYTATTIGTAELSTGSVLPRTLAVVVDGESSMTVESNGRESAIANNVKTTIALSPR